MGAPLALRAVPPRGSSSPRRPCDPRTLDASACRPPSTLAGALFEPGLRPARMDDLGTARRRSRGLLGHMPRQPEPLRECEHEKESDAAPDLVENPRLFGVVERHIPVGERHEREEPDPGPGKARPDGRRQSDALHYVREQVAAEQ